MEIGRCCLFASLPLLFAVIRALDIERRAQHGYLLASGVMLTLTCGFFVVLLLLVSRSQAVPARLLSPFRNQHSAKRCLGGDRNIAPVNTVQVALDGWLWRALAALLGR